MFSLTGFRFHQAAYNLLAALLNALLAFDPNVPTVVTITIMIKLIMIAYSVAEVPSSSRRKAINIDITKTFKTTSRRLMSNLLAGYSEKLSQA